MAANKKILICDCFPNDYDEILNWVEKRTVCYLNCFVEKSFIPPSKYKLYLKFDVVKISPVVQENSQVNHFHGDALVKKIVQEPKVKEESSHLGVEIVPLAEQLDVKDDFG